MLECIKPLHSLSILFKVHEATLGREHPGTAAACLSLGNLCVIHRDLRQAKLWFESAVAILDTCFGGRCVQVVDRLSDGFLGLVHESVCMQCRRRRGPTYVYTFEHLFICRNFFFFKSLRKSCIYFAQQSLNSNRFVCACV